MTFYQNQTNRLYEVPAMAAISDFFSEYKLTRSQSEAIDALEVFLNDPEKNVFILKGYAGTGKTFLTKGISSYLRSIGRQVVLCAPTGKAAKVLGERSQAGAVTIHRKIYGEAIVEPFLDEQAGSDAAKTGTFRLHLGIRTNQDNADTVYVVDEASMVSDVYTDSEFCIAGSGYLLKDLIKYINFDINEHDKKLIFIGDPAQLPPIRQALSPALSEQYMEKNYGLRCSSVELTEVVRQKSKSGILDNATELRKAIVVRRFNHLSLEANDVDVAEIDSRDLLAQYIENIKTSDISSTAIIAETNRKNNLYNRLIHNYLFPDKPEMQPGDLLMVCRNDALFANGTLVFLRDIIGDPIRRKVTLKRRNEATKQTEIIPISLVFRKVLVQEVGSNDVYERILLENFVYQEEGSLSSDQNKALFVDFLLRNEDINYSKIKKDAFELEKCRSRMASDPYLRCLIAKWGYSFTCHKAQGSEWKNVILDCESFGKAAHNETYFRWLYTAVTRAKRKLYFFNAPRFTSSSGLTFVGSSPRMGLTEQPLGNWRRAAQLYANDSSDAFVNRTQSFHTRREMCELGTARESHCPIESSEKVDASVSLWESDSQRMSECSVVNGSQASEEDFSGVLRKAVSEKLAPLDAKVVEIKHHPYCESFFVDCGGDYVRTDVFYNADKEITKVRPGGTDALSVTVAKVVRSLTGASFQTSTKVATCESASGINSSVGSRSDGDLRQTQSHFVEEFKQEFFNRLQTVAASRCISVALIRELPWALRVNFQGFGGQAVTDFFYNSKEEFTKVNHVVTKRLTPELDAAISAVVQELAL